LTSNKKSIRDNFRNAVFKRDGYRCVCCGLKSSPQTAEQDLDAHHIVDRHEIENGGYCSSNGISLCKKPNGCHWKAEALHRDGVAEPGFSPDDLFAKIGSSEEKAREDAKKIK
jgi:predicted restriction endonuclease